MLGLRLGGRHFGLDVVERRLKLDVFGRRVLLVRAATSGPEFVHSSAEKHGADGGGGDDGENDTDACRGGALARGVVGAVRGGAKDGGTPRVPIKASGEPTTKEPPSIAAAAPNSFCPVNLSVCSYVSPPSLV